MITLRKQRATIFVDRINQKWVVQDPEGNFWSVPSEPGVEYPWEQRQPFYPTEETELELVPGHYKFVLGLPF